MIRRVGEKETGTPLLNSISKMRLFRLLCSCLPIERLKILKDLFPKFLKYFAASDDAFSRSCESTSSKFSMKFEFLSVRNPLHNFLSGYDHFEQVKIRISVKFFHQLIHKALKNHHLRKQKFSKILENFCTIF